MLQIENLTITHRKDLKIILENFNCVLNNGDKAVIIGEEGNGKSTLLKWIFRPEMIGRVLRNQRQENYPRVKDGVSPAGASSRRR